MNKILFLSGIRPEKIISRVHAVGQSFTRDLYARDGGHV
jgi:hypothetical protein